MEIRLTDRSETTPQFDMDKLFRPGSSSTARSSGRNYGMNVFVNRDPLASEAIDIVAVHGLNGHYEKTWTNETSQFNWLKDGIPKVIPLARVMSFSYNSSVQFSKSTSDLFVFADQLLESLSAERTTVAEQDRQIIFICHSLGGLVVKQVRSPCIPAASPGTDFEAGLGQGA